MVAQKLLRNKEHEDAHAVESAMRIHAYLSTITGLPASVADPAGEIRGCIPNHGNQ